MGGRSGVGGGTQMTVRKCRTMKKSPLGVRRGSPPPNTGSGMLLGTFLGFGDVVGVNSRRHGCDIDSFCSILSGGEAKCPYCSNCTLVRKKRAEARRGAPEAKKVHSHKSKIMKNWEKKKNFFFKCFRIMSQT